MRIMTDDQIDETLTYLGKFFATGTNGKGSPNNETMLIHVGMLLWITHTEVF